MRKVLTVVLAVVLVVVVVNFLGRAYAQNQVTSVIATNTTNVQHVGASFDEGTFLVNFLAGGKVHSAKFILNNVATPTLHVTQLTATAQNLKFDSGSLFGTWKVSSSGPVLVTARLTEEDLRQAIQATSVTFEIHRMHVIRKDGVTVDGPATLSGRHIVVTGADGKIVLFPVPSPNLMPCKPSALYVYQGQDAAVSCVSSTLPPIIANAIGTKQLKAAAGTAG